MAQYLLDLLSPLSNCINCFPTSPRLKIKNRSLKILRLLGEGGFSYVYLVQDTHSSSLHALKKIRCPFGAESVTHALKEVEAYTLFAGHPNIIRAEDYSVVADKSDPGAKTVYIVLPYYRRGNLQDAINANLVNGTRFEERRLMRLVLGVCRALRAMHGYRVAGGGENREEGARRVRAEARRRDGEAVREVQQAAAAGQQQRRRREGGEDGDVGERGADTEREQEQEPLMEERERETVTRAQEGVTEGSLRAYAHRDIKPGWYLFNFSCIHLSIHPSPTSDPHGPSTTDTARSLPGNIMLSDDGRTPILMDLGSTAPSPIPITSRSLALQVQDTAAEHSTMPYRAPELFDVKTGSVVDTKVDIWSLGCTLYACLVGKSPFEARSEETGGSLGLCILGGDWRFPDEDGGGGGNKDKRGKGKGKGKAKGVAGGANGSVAQANGDGTGKHGWSEGVRDVVRRCLKVEPAERPDIDELIAVVEGVLEGLGGAEEDEDEDEDENGGGET
ncbi:MAG: hypothetical protein M1816_002103 [Peltula sp. TS41687]|nr:MAG: hypothetical protein M1816_002103 [Peltula sp. TS41687]